MRSDRLFCEMLDYKMLFRWFLDMGLEEASFARRQSRFLQGASRGAARIPRVIAAWTDPEHAAHRSYRKLNLVRSHQSEDSFGFVSACRANEAVAFARISRSSFTLRSPRRSWLNSSRSVLVRKSRRLPPLASVCATQLRIACAVGSNSRASS